MTIIDRQTLAQITTGATHVIERNGAEAYVYFETDSTAHMLLDDGETRCGTWRLTDTGYATNWDNGSAGTWSLERDADGVSYVDAARGIRLKMLGVLFGNPKGLPRRAAG